ncbi:hypothetical protein AbraIFM66950_004581 [Aspergillus brasiliensis]|nr:hypothetical protein AbraIFM66950_004581 [Aspergillus brasiliensis]
MSFQYGTLDPAQRQIRLLSIHPSIIKSGPVHCSLHTVSLNDNQKFEALSYVWGTDDTTEQIFLDGNTFYVTPNVAKALHHLRHPFWRRYIWVDAICINQCDVDEKNTQVPLMATLYATADRVVAMIGDATPEIELAVTWTERYVDRKFTIGALYWRWLDIASIFSARARVNRLNALSRTLLGVNEISTRPYWFRMWTYQEFILPKREPIIVCGNMELQITKAPGIHNPLWNRANRPFLSMTKDFIKRGGAMEALKLHTRSRVLHNIAFTKFREIMIMRTTMRSSTVGATALDHLAKTRDRQCQNPRDKIYALYGVLPELQKAYPPDYNKTIEQIALETTAWLIDETSISRFFRESMFSARNPLNTSLPSWVPDYHAQDSEFMQFYFITELSDIRLELPEHMKLYISQDGSVLHLPALRAGKCQVLLEFSNDWRKVASQLLGVFEMIEKQWGRDWDIALLQRRLVRASYRYFPLAVDGSIEGMLAVLRKLAQADPSIDGDRKGWNPKEPESYADRIQLLSHHKLFLASNSFGCIFGISPEPVEDGDIFTIPYGLDRPLILRVAETSERNDERTYYRIVGQAFAGDSSPPNPFCDSLTEEHLEEFLVI